MDSWGCSWQGICPQLGEEKRNLTCLGYCCCYCFYTSISSGHSNPMARLLGVNPDALFAPLLKAPHSGQKAMPALAKAPQWGWRKSHSVCPSHPPIPRYSAWCSLALTRSCGQGGAAQGCQCCGSLPAEAFLAPPHNQCRRLEFPWSCPSYTLGAGIMNCICLPLILKVLLTGKVLNHHITPDFVTAQSII